MGVRLLKKDGVSEQARQDGLARHFSDYQRFVHEYEHLPPEFIQISPDVYKVATPEDFARVAPHFGRAAVSQTVGPVARIIRQTNSSHAA